MKAIRTSVVLTPTAAVVSALATIACCLPWGIGAALGAVGLSVVFAKFQVWFLAISVLLLLFGLFQVLRKGSNCAKRSRVEIAFLSIAAIVVLAVVFFPQWVAELLVGRLP